MPYSVRCKACSSAFAIPDEIWNKRVRGRLATLKCRTCKAEIHVDGTKDGVTILSAPPPPAPEPLPAATPAKATAPVAPNPPNPPAEPAASLPKAQGSGVADKVVRVATTDPATETPTPVVGVQFKALESTKQADSPIRAAATPSPSPPTAAALSQKPLARSAVDIAAPDTGWSLMPPASELEQVGLSPKAPKAPDIPTATATTTTTATRKQTEPVSVAPESVSAQDLVEDAPPDPDLWVVSYGEDDDRELTEKQIAAELVKGALTLSTIVWQEGMPEWLPISGVKLLAKYARSHRPVAARQAKPASPNKAGAQPPRSSALSATRAESPVARQAIATRQKQPSSAQQETRDAPRDIGSDPRNRSKASAETPAQGPQSHAADQRSAPKAGPPPLVRSEERSAAVGGLDDSRYDSELPSVLKTVRGQPPALPTETGQSAARPPSLIRRAQPAVDPAHTQTTESDIPDEVLTSAPAPGAIAHGRRVEVEASRVASSHDSAPRDVGSRRSAAKASFRPPKPVETATSLVMRTETAAGQDLLITDEDFLAMQRRFPKWALPVAIVGGLAVIGGIVYAANSSEELPPLPIAPVVDSAPRENPANQAQPRHPQPNLDALPTGAASGETGTAEKDFARLFAQSASKTNGTFDSRAAERAALNFLELAARCRVAPDPSGQARVVLTFSTAGQVLSVQVGSPYADTTTGKCIEKALRNIKTRPFKGEPGRLPLTVPIH